MKPPNENGAPVSRGAALCDSSESKTPDALGETVNALEMARSVDEAILTYRRAATDPVEFQRLGLWLQRMRRALP